MNNNKIERMREIIRGGVDGEENSPLMKKFEASLCDDFTRSLILGLSEEEKNAMRDSIAEEFDLCVGGFQHRNIYFFDNSPFPDIRVRMGHCGSGGFRVHDFVSKHGGIETRGYAPYSPIIVTLERCHLGKIVFSWDC